MRIDRARFEAAALAAFEAVTVGNEALLTDRALLAFAEALGVEVVDVCMCSPTRRMYCAADDCCGGGELLVWALRTWADVRAGDTVRRPGSSEHEARVVSIGPVNEWHVDDRGLTPSQARNAQFRPGEYARVWRERSIELDPPVPAPGVDPALAVEIRVTAAEMAAIELLGGWENRL